MKRIENSNAPKPRTAGDYSRQSLDFRSMAWYAASPTLTLGNAFRSWSLSPTSNPSRGGTIHREEDAARGAVDYFMDVSVPRQREERAGHTLPTDRLEYVNGELAIIDASAQYNRYFSAPEPAALEPGSVGGVVAIQTGLGRYFLRRHKRLEDGSLQVQRPDPQVEAILEPLYTHDIIANDGNWGADDDGQSYPVAADVANAAFPGTYPPYEPRRLPQDEEAYVLTRRARSLPGDPVAARETPDERMERTMYDHLDGTSQAWNV